MKISLQFLILGLISIPSISYGKTLSAPMKFVSVAPGFYVDQYHKMDFDGRVASIVRIPLATSTLILSDLELPRLENEEIRKVFLGPTSGFAAFDLSRQTFHAAYSGKGPFIVSSHIDLDKPHEALDRYLTTISLAGFSEFALVIQTANLTEYSLTFKSLEELKSFLGLSKSAEAELPTLCINALTTTPVPYLRLVK